MGRLGRVVVSVVVGALLALGVPLLAASPASAAGFTVSGTVTGTEAGLPALAGIKVEVADASTELPVTSTTTAANGSYSIPGLDGDYYLSFSSPTGLRKAVTYYFVSVTDDSPGNDVQLDPAGAIAGVVRDGSGTPIQALVQLYRSTDGPFGLDPVDEVTAAADGTYRFGGLDAGTDYALGFDTGLGCPGGCPPIVPEYWQDVTSGDPTLVTVTEGAVTTISPTVTRQGAIRGTLTRSGSPVEGTWVYAAKVGTDPDNDWSEYAAVTEADGTFSIPLPAGSYKLRFETSGFATFWYSSSPDRLRATVVTVAGESTTNLGSVTFPFTGAVAGTVRSGGVAVADGGWVSLADSRNQYVGSAEIAPNGTYRIDGVAPGAYELEVGATGYAGVTSTVTIASTTVTRDVVVVAEPSLATVQVSATTAGATPLAGGGEAVLYKAGVDGYELERCYLDVVDGTCSMSVPPGDYQLGINPDAPGYAQSFYGGGDTQTTSTPFTLAAGAVSPRSVTVVTAGSVQVIADNATSLALDLDLSIGRGADSVYDDTVGPISSGGTRTFTVGRLRPGTYTVTGRSSSTGEVASTVVTVVSGSAVNAPLSFSAESAAEVEANEPATGSVTGLVVVPGGAPAVDYEVCAYDWWSDLDRCGRTTAAGRYTIAGVHADPFLFIYVTPKNGEFQPQTVVNHQPTVANPTQVPTIALIAPVTLGGKVTTNGTTPASDVVVSLRMNGAEYASVATGADGRWNVSDMPPGLYKVLADPRSVAFEPTWRPNVLDESSAQTYDATLGSSSTLDVQLVGGLTPTTTRLTTVGSVAHVGDDATLSAKVTTFVGGVVASGSVRFVDDETDAPIATVALNGSGVATTAWTVPRRYATVRAYYLGGAPYGTSNDVLYTEASGYATTTTLAAPTTAVAHSSVTLTATVAATNPAVPNLAGSVSFYSGSSYLGSGEVVGGTASITTTTFGVGTHKLLARFVDYSGQCGALTANGCTIVTTGTGRFESSTSAVRTLTVSAAPATTGRVTGKVTRDGGATALPDVTVTLYKADGTLVREATTDAAGVYGFGAVAPGSYKLRYSGTSVVTEWWQNQTSAASATSVAITAGTTTTLNASLAQPPGSIEGTLTDIDQNPVDADVLVCLAGTPRTTSSCRSTTSLGGQFTVAGLAAGSYVVTALPLDDWLRSTSKGATVASTAVAVDLTLPLLAGPPGSVTLSGQHATSNGLPVLYWDNATPVSWTTCANGTSATWTALDDAGATRTGALTATPAGSTTYTGTIPALSPSHGTVHVTFAITCPGTGATSTAFDVYVDPSGVVKDTNGAPIADATVVLKRFDAGSNSYRTLYNGSDVMSPSNRTNPDLTSAAGRFGWDVKPGHYVVTATKDGCFKPGSPGTASVSTGDLEIPPPVTDLQLVLQCPSLPGAPTITSAVPGNGSATVTWTAPASNGGAPILDYTVVASPGGASVVTSGLSAVVPGLVNGQTYTFTVTARTVAGSGPASAASAPITLPIQGDGGGGGTLPPTLALTGSASAVTVGKPGLTWRTTARSYPVARVEVQSRVALVAGGFGAWAPAATLAAGATSWTLASPKPAASYCLQVRAVDTQGNSSAWAQRCTSLAGDDTLLKASKGWKAKSLKGALGGKVRLSTKKGATLTLAKATGKSLVIFVAKAKGSGTIGVYVKGKRVAKLSLSASKAALARLVVRTGSYAGAPIVIKVEKPGKGVRIDGIAVLK